MKVGDYVRTRQGSIFKWDKYMTITKEEHREVDSPYIYINQNDIIKSSPNIIDLIEVGDYVNGGMVDLINDKYIGIENQEGYIIKKGFKIERIVTKEQFESMEYRIG